MTPTPPTTRQIADLLLACEQAGREIDARFREALRRGETSGDVVVLDNQGNEIMGALSSKTIFDLWAFCPPKAATVIASCGPIS